MLRLPSLVDSVIVVANGGSASVVVSPRGELRRVALFGRAGWETKFVLAALEERGWQVDASLSVAPGISVSQGRPAVLDTSTHAAVVVLDSIARGDAAAIVQFVQTGGGLVLGPAAFLNGALGQVAPGALGDQGRPAQLGFVSNVPLSNFAYTSLELRGDAVALARVEGDVTIAARRERLGRVVQIGFEDTWRWRMLGDDGVRQHRAWWNQLVSSVAVASTEDRLETPDAAPFAQTVAALGAPASIVRGVGRARASLWPLLLSILVLSMFGEWTSRRIAGNA
jgi:hypothetical protein